MEIFTDIELPDYSPSIPPDYSSAPLPGEQCIQRTPRQTAPFHDNCAFTYEERGMSLTLRGCREEDGIPTFGLCSTVYGEFAPADRKKIVSVVVKVRIMSPLLIAIFYLGRSCRHKFGRKRIREYCCILFSPKSVCCGGEATRPVTYVLAYYLSRYPSRLHIGTKIMVAHIVFRHLCLSGAHVEWLLCTR
ncbi:hypothetical protein J3R83DRAFT_12902 [Lanmaoa asiatica]|nr:hypothetical protein J3R83DRAFT_12902 [Lanmaoa asiatica]